MNNVEYWKNRARQKMLASERSTLKILRNTRKLYKQAQKTIIQEIEKMYEQAGATYGEDVSKYMKETLHGDERNRLIRDLKKYIKDKGLDYVLSDDFGRRLTRLDALQKKIEIELVNLRKQTQTLQTKGYKEVMSTVYGYDAKDVEEIGKYPIGGGNLEKRVISEVSKNDSNWADGTYRTRNTKNVNNMTSKINSIIGAGMAIGQSREKTARQVRDQFGISSRKAMRLVQTESNYYAGQVDLEAYRAMGVEYYQYLDVLDEKTCEGCQELDTKVFPVDMANVGVNYHPMHPNCRCGTVPYDPEFDTDKPNVRSARDVVTGKSYLTTAKDYEGYKISQNMKHGKGTVQLAAKMNANKFSDKEQYERYKKVFGDRWKTLEDFQEMKYTKIKEYAKAKKIYSVARRYEVNYGNLAPEKIYSMYNSNVEFKNLFSSRYRNERKTAGILEINGDKYFSHSAVKDKESKAYKNMKVHKKNIVFLKKEGYKLHPTEYKGYLRDVDVEAKFLEYVADLVDEKKISSTSVVNILVDNPVCESCQRVVEEFRNKYKSITVNLVSHR